METINFCQFQIINYKNIFGFFNAAQQNCYFPLKTLIFTEKLFINIQIIGFYFIKGCL